MNDVGCGELAEIVEGQLQLGMLPPLGGRLELIGDIVTDCERVQPGSLYWPLHSVEHAPLRTQEAFMRGAVGAVVSHAAATCPLDGRFQVVVDCAREAICRFGRSRRLGFDGKLVLAGPGAPADEIPQGLGAHSHAFLVEDLADAAQAMVALTDGELAVLSLSAKAFWQIDEIFALCCPHAVCIYNLPRGEDVIEPGAIAGLQAGFLDNGCFVWVDGRHHKVTVGDREFLATEVGQDVFQVADEQFAVKRTHLPLALACWGVAEAVNWRLPAKLRRP